MLGAILSCCSFNTTRGFFKRATDLEQDVPVPVPSNLPSAPQVLKNTDKKSAIGDLVRGAFGTPCSWNGASREQFDLPPSSRSL
jgi:hypothetical protein